MRTLNGLTSGAIPHDGLLPCARGVQTWQIGGRGLPDLLCWYQHRPTVLEVKSGASARLSRVQADQNAPWPIVRSVTEAVEAVCERSDV